METFDICLKIFMLFIYLLSSGLNLAKGKGWEAILQLTIGVLFFISLFAGRL